MENSPGVKSLISAMINKIIAEAVPNINLEKLPTFAKNRKKDTMYVLKDELMFWDGKTLKCQHKKRKLDCVLCMTSQICWHLRRRKDCKECKGNQRCEEHNAIKAYCIECAKKGIECSQICMKHLCIKSQCKECGDGKKLCVHGTRKDYCNKDDCKGNQICEHGLSKVQCRKCKDLNPEAKSNFCSHDILKPTCKICSPGNFCEHLVMKCACKICDGNSICKHGSRKNRCVKCTPNSNFFCKLCRDIEGRKKYNGYCFGCYCKEHPDEIIPRRRLLKENYIHNFLKECFPDVTFFYNKEIVCGTSKKKPDWMIDLHSRFIILECDENGHLSTKYICENKRMMALFQDAGCRPGVFIRMNPDKFEDKCCFDIDHKGNIKPTSTWETRKLILRDTIQKYLDKEPEKEITVEYLFYSDAQIQHSTQFTNTRKTDSDDDEKQIVEDVKKMSI